MHRLTILFVANLLLPTIAALPNAAVSTGEGGIGEAEQQRQAKVHLDERENFKRAHLEKVSQESLEAAIAMLRKEYFLPQLRALTSISLPNDLLELQRVMLHEPRVGKILAAARNRSDETRKKILDSIVHQIDQYLDERQKIDSGRVLANSDGMLNAGLAFPLLLAEVDTSGASLSILLEWYQIERRSWTRRWRF